ncbi:MAG: hypothetical protein ACJA09_003154 [Alcanivorax sp.]|jgi:hypothetical protein
MRETGSLMLSPGAPLRDLEQSRFDSNEHNDAASITNQIEYDSQAAHFGAPNAQTQCTALYANVGDIRCARRNSVTSRARTASIDRQKNGTQGISEVLSRFLHHVRGLANYL